MLYQIIGKDVYVEGKKIGTQSNNLLVLDSKTSNIEWDKVEDEVKRKDIFNGKINREENGYHHSYKIINGTIHRLDHSISPKTGKLDLMEYENRGYLGSGHNGNVKGMSTRLKNEEPLVQKSSKLTYKKYKKLLEKGYSSEALINKQFGSLIQESIEIIKEKNTTPIANRNNNNETTEPFFAKKILVMKKISGIAALNITMNEQKKRPKAPKLSLLEKLYLTINLTRSCAKAFNYGFLHRDIKPDNYIYDRNKLTGDLCDWEFGVKIPKNQKVFHAHAPKGTKEYMPPEHFLYSVVKDFPVTYSESSEVYSLGWCLYMLFENDPDSDIGTEYAKYINQHLLCGFEGTSLIMKLMSKEVEWNDVFARFLIFSALKAPNRISYEQILTYFTAQLKKNNLPEIKKNLNRISETFGNEKALLFLELASWYHVIDDNRAEKFCRMAFECATTQNIKEWALLKMVAHVEFHAETILLFPEYQKAYNNLTTCLVYLNSLSLNTEAINKVKEQISTKLTELEKQIGLQLAKNILKQNVISDEDKNQIANIYLKIAQRTSELDEKIKYYERALKWLPPNNQKEVELLIKNSYLQMFDIYYRDKDLRIAEHCATKLEKYHTPEEHKPINLKIRDLKNESIHLSDSRLNRVTLLKFSSAKPKVYLPKVDYTEVNRLLQGLNLRQSN